jgi:hypothetical protein
MLKFESRIAALKIRAANHKTMPDSPHPLREWRCVECRYAII